MITQSEFDKAKKTIDIYRKQENKRLKDNNLCLICKTPIGHTVGENSIHWCEDCFNEAMNAGEDERGTPIH